MNAKRGFTMVELMVVMEIILLMAALAIPQLQRAIMSAREGSAVGSLKAIASGQAGFKEAAFRDDDGNGEGDYGTLAQLANPDGAGNSAPFIDTDLATGIKSRYIFTVTVTPGGPGGPPGYVCTAIPSVPGRTAYKMYYLDETGTIRFTADGTAPGPDSQPL